MPNLQRVVKPKTRKGKCFLESRLPKVLEDEKIAMFIRGANANNTVLQAMKDIATFKKPNAVLYNRKNDAKPFENFSSLEFLSQKSDASLFAFGSNNKKRPNNLVLGRLHDYRLLDMFEFGIENYKSLSDFKNTKFVVGSKPLLVFSGEAFENDPVYQRLKNLLIDFFRGSSVENLNLRGIDHIMLFTETLGKIHFRNYRIGLKNSSIKAPDVDLEEMGPHMDWIPRRNSVASPDLFKQACRKSSMFKPKKVKNMKRDVFGTKHGRIHMQRQDYAQLQTRKVKGLKSKKKTSSGGDRQSSSNDDQPRKPTNVLQPH